MQVNNAGIYGTILDGDALAASGLGKVSYESMIGWVDLDVTLRKSDLTVTSRLDIMLL